MENIRFYKYPPQPSAQKRHNKAIPADPPRSLDNGAIGADSIKEKVNGLPDLGATGQALSPSPDVQHRDSSAHKPASDSDAQLEIPETQQSPPWHQSVYDPSKANMSHLGAQLREYHCFPGTQDPFSGGAGRSDAMIEATLGCKPSSMATHDNQSARSQSWTPESVSNDHGCDHAPAPPVSVVVENRPDLGPAISSQEMPRGNPAEVASQTDDLRHQHRDMNNSPAVMLTDSPVSTRRATGPDITIYPLEQTDSCIMTAIAGSLREVQQLSKAPDAWQVPRPMVPSDHITIICIKPLDHDLWLLLAKISSLARSKFDASDDSDEAAGHHIRPRRKRSNVRVMTSDDDSEWAEDHVREQPAKRKRTQPITRGALGPKRGDWQQSEDQKLAELKEEGASWSSIFAEFPQRSEAQLRSRWYSKLKSLVS